MAMEAGDLGALLLALIVLVGVLATLVVVL